MDEDDLPAGRAQRRRLRIDARIAAVARRQDNVVTVGDLRSEGVSPSAIDRRTGDLLHPMFRGVFLFGRSTPTPRERLRGALRAGGPEAVLGARAASAHWGLGPLPAEIEIIVPRDRRLQPGLIPRTRVLDPADRTTRRGLPVTTVARTAVDLAAASALDDLKRYVHEAECRRLFRLHAFDQAVERAGRFRGKPMLLDALAVHRPLRGKVVSGNERLFHAFLAERGYPPTEHNALFHLGGEDWVSFDVFFPEHWLAVEIDSPVHDSADARIADAARDRLVLAVLDVPTFRVRDTELQSRPDTIDCQLRAALARREGIGDRRRSAR
jgi:hypothetical protein